VKLEAACASGQPVELSEEFRRLTLQVIGEAILSLSPEESDRVFPHLYLPIMEEGNRRSLEPWRTYLPTPAWFRQRSRVRQLNAYIIGAQLNASHHITPSLTRRANRRHAAGSLEAETSGREGGATCIVGLRSRPLDHSRWRL
jgi:cytochrome P450